MKRAKDEDEKNVGLDVANIIDLWSLLWVFGGGEDWSLGDQGFDQSKQHLRAFGRLDGQ